eukprot:TRINITY_DN920_c0_g1_i1.p2 TRINITY_DN920_c0_g1~~TRINITY_DN920_c0_g1_i1.p2  ORF type:complete len:107 (+),score=16.86 TRINITY_DN920_c0_g1_i1:78-398(+)
MYATSMATSRLRYLHAAGTLDSAWVAACGWASPTTKGTTIDRQSKDCQLQGRTDLICTHLSWWAGCSRLLCITTFMGPLIDKTAHAANSRQQLPRSSESLVRRQNE